jgi:amidase
MNVVTSDQRSTKFSSQLEPALRVLPGEVVKMETSPEPIEELFAAGDNWEEALDLENFNQVTGPVYIEGVQPGDGVAVDILEIEPLDWGWNSYLPGFSLVASRLQDMFLQRVSIVEGWVHLSERLIVPVRPMVGCLGLAPPEGESTTLGCSPWGGNYDLMQMKDGNTAVFPAQVPGGLFYLGDLHAAMGAAEPTYNAVECAGTVTIRFSIHEQMGLVNPRVESADHLYILGLSQSGAENRWDESRRQACELVFDYLTYERDLTNEEAYMLISTSVDLTYGGPAGVSVASIPLRVFE